MEEPLLFPALGPWSTVNPGGPPDPTGRGHPAGTQPRLWRPCHCPIRWLQDRGVRLSPCVPAPRWLDGRPSVSSRAVWTARGWVGTVVCAEAWGPGKASWCRCCLFLLGLQVGQRGTGTSGSGTRALVLFSPKALNVPKALPSLPPYLPPRPDPTHQ